MVLNNGDLFADNVNEFEATGVLNECVNFSNICHDSGHSCKQAATKTEVGSSHVENFSVSDAAGALLRLKSY